MDRVLEENLNTASTYVKSHSGVKNPVFEVSEI